MKTTLESLFDPKTPPVDPDFTSKPYYQVYQQRHGFLENMSINRPPLQRRKRVNTLPYIAKHTLIY